MPGDGQVFGPVRNQAVDPEAGLRAVLCAVVVLANEGRHVARPCFAGVWAKELPLGRLANVL